MVSIIFTVTSVSSRLTDTCIYAGLVGDIPELGGWDPENAIRATGPHDGEYMTTVIVPKGLDKIEFKWIFFYRDYVIWEDGPNKIVTNLPQTRRSVCYITNPIHGPARIEINRSSKSLINLRNDVTRRKDPQCLSKILNPWNWSRRSRIFGFGFGFLVAVSIYKLASKLIRHQ